MGIVPLEATALVPHTEAQIAIASEHLANTILRVARHNLEESVDNFGEHSGRLPPEKRSKWNGAQETAMIAEEAVRVYGLVEIAFETAGEELNIHFNEVGGYHPDLRSDPQEFLDELQTRVAQNRMHQSAYFVHEVLPQARKYGVDVDAWLKGVYKYNLFEVMPFFRQLAEAEKLVDPRTGEVTELTPENREAAFRGLVELSMKRQSEIRRVLMRSGPEEFSVIETGLEDGVSWVIPHMTDDTSKWLLRRASPFGVLERGE